jgi:chemotaxis methyl-accepting protein methylase
MSNGLAYRAPGAQAPLTRIAPAFLAVNERIWNRLPARMRDLRAVRRYGVWAHTVVNRWADREMYLGTHFLRNRPELELMRRLVETAAPGAPVKIAVLGCSIGVEVYSIVSTLRGSRPDLDISVYASDISVEAVRIGEQGVYGADALALAAWPIFDGLSEAERADLFDWDGDAARVKPWLRDGLTWEVSDAADPTLAVRLGRHDIVVANNFLCHMPAASARQCLRNLAQLVAPGGYLFVTGVDLDVRTEAAWELGWEPVAELRAEIHDGDPLVRADWPWRWWGLEPLDSRRRDWETRYSAVFRIPESRGSAMTALQP